MVIRLMQSFKNFRLAMEEHPESLPPPEWKASGVGRKAVEKVNLKSHLTIYAKVSHTSYSLSTPVGCRKPYMLTPAAALSKDGLWVKMDEV